MAALAAAVILPAASAQAATKTVVAGPLKPVKGVFGGKASGDVDAFSLKTVTVQVGDKVRWKFNGFHTVTFNKKGGKDIPFVIPDPSGAKYSGINDAAGSPFWFNGQPRLVLNPLGAFPQGGNTENGSQVTGTGIPQGNGNPKPYTLKFTKAGVFHYECVIHPGMEGIVKVVAKGKRIPSAAQDRRTAAKLFAREVRQARKLAKGPKLAKSTVQGGNDRSPVVQLRFFPSKIHVPVGGSVRFQVKSRPEIHTFTFGPASYLNSVANGLITPAAGGAGPPSLVFSGQVSFPSETPPALVFNGTNHGNGFFNTGILDGDPSSPQPSATTVKFTKAGTYSYICLIHPFMRGTVVVGP